APTRKPGTALLTKYLEGDYDLKNSFVIGDRATDVELAVNLGARSIYFSSETHPDADLATTDWDAVAREILFQDRAVVLKRRTNETDIEVALSLDGDGSSEVRAGIGFF